MGKKEDLMKDPKKARGSSRTSNALANNMEASWKGESRQE